jgi:hypothetical protein
MDSLVFSGFEVFLVFPGDTQKNTKLECLQLVFVWFAYVCWVCGFLWVYSTPENSRNFERFALAFCLVCLYLLGLRCFDGLQVIKFVQICYSFASLGYVTFTLLLMVYFVILR